MLLTFAAFLGKPGFLFKAIMGAERLQSKQADAALIEYKFDMAYVSANSCILSHLANMEQN